MAREESECDEIECECGCRTFTAIKEFYSGGYVTLRCTKCNRKIEL